MMASWNLPISIQNTWGLKGAEPREGTQATNIEQLSKVEATHRSSCQLLHGPVQVLFRLVAAGLRRPLLPFESRANMSKSELPWE